VHRGLDLQIAAAHAALQAGHALLRQDLDCPHERQVDDHPTAGGVAAEVVTPASHVDPEPMLAGVRDGGDDVGGAGAAGDDLGPCVGPLVEDGAGRLVGGIVGFDPRPPEVRGRNGRHRPQPYRVSLTLQVEGCRRGARALLALSFTFDNSAEFQ
jgi:hypothetical protein